MRHRLAKHSHVIDKHFSMLPSPELRRRNIDQYHKMFSLRGKNFHANKLQNGLAILSLQTCMLTALTAHWLFIARTVQWTRVALRRTVQWIRIVLRATLRKSPLEKNTEFCKFLQAMPKPGKVMGSHTI